MTFKINKIFIIITSCIEYAIGTETDKKPRASFHYSGPVAERVIGGSDALPGEFKWQVSIQALHSSGGPATPFCGGSILDPEHIITAAHCLQPPETPDKIVVVAGAHNVFNPDGTEQNILVSAWEVHELFDPDTYNNDIALIRLASPLAFNTRVGSITLPPQGFITSGTCVNTGWGNIRNDGSIQYPEVLQKVTLQTFDRTTCEERFDGINVITIGMVCAGDERGNKGTCKGDSGGPLVCKDSNNQDYLAGLVSWGVEPCAKNGSYPSVFTNVANYINWIYGEFKRL